MPRVFFNFACPTKPIYAKGGKMMSGVWDTKESSEVAQKCLYTPRQVINASDASHNSLSQSIIGLLTDF